MEHAEYHSELHTAALLLGGNLGDVPALLRRAAAAIAGGVGEVRAASALYRTPPWGFASEHDFFNQALLVSTPLAPLPLLDALMLVEHRLGRRRPQGCPPEGGQRYADRPIDIDIIFYDCLVLSHPRLALPHPRAHLRRFVLQPLAEVAPQLVHPLLGHTVAQLLDACPDASVVERIF